MNTKQLLKACLLIAAVFLLGCSGDNRTEPSATKTDVSAEEAQNLLQAPIQPNMYLPRASAALVGLYGNSGEEAVYPAYFVDNEGDQLNAADHNYVMKFAGGELPPAKAFPGTSSSRTMARW
jgi:hypothetical protein